MVKKILIIDDNEVDLLIIKKHLQHSGYEHIITASDANEGLKRAIDDKPDLVISDTLLPDSNGFEICRRIREISGKENPKIIIITGSVDAVDAAQARRVGADDYCGKTSDCAPLIEAVKKLT